MPANDQPEVVLYDLACTPGVCFSPAVWRVRLTLNYKKIPYRTVFVEFPDIEQTLKGLGIKPNEKGAAYTVPAIEHLPSKTVIMESYAICQFLEATYPDPVLIMSSDFGKEIESKARAGFAGAYRISIEAREPNILSPRSAEYFRRTRGATLGHPLEDLLADGKEDAKWKDLEPKMREVGELLEKNKDEGPFVLGKQPSITDFFFAGSLQTAKVVHPETFEKNVSFPGFRRIYEGCAPWIEKED